MIFPGQANGSLIKRDGVVVGSALIGQQFYEPVLGKNGKQSLSRASPRPSPTRATSRRAPPATPADNAAGDGRSRTRPNSMTTLATSRQHRRPTWRSTGPNGSRTTRPLTSAAQIPVDAVTARPPRIDPDISVANADIQAYRIAAVRHLSLASVDSLVAQYTTARSLGFLGEPGVDVLELNLALDRITGSK